MSVLFAATHPERTRALALVGCYAKRIRSEDYPWAPTWEQRLAEIEGVESTWGDPAVAAQLAPSRKDDPVFLSWMSRYMRASASPKAAAALLRMNSMMDVRAVLPTIRVPTLLVYRTDDPDVAVEEGRYIASRIPGSRFVELPGADHLMWTGEADAILDEVEAFLTGARRGPEPDRVLTTVLFTDIVDSTRLASKLGDRAWGERLERHHARVRRELERWRGHEVETAGDGFLATFDGPARAVRCAGAVVEAVHEEGLRIRAGIHTGEVELVDGAVRGIAVHIGARVAALAGPDEVFVSRTVVDLVSGSGLRFEDRGEHRLKGVPGGWQVNSARAD
jgi:class 3 adenylate cyclase